MEINNIKGFLERFKNLQPPDNYIKEVFIDVIKEKMSVDITFDEIKVQKHTIFLNVHPTLKVEIFFKKNEILRALAKKLKKQKISNII